MSTQPSAEGARDSTRDRAPETASDVESDPALADETGSEWADEGGATDDGPATDPEAS